MDTKSLFRAILPELDALETFLNETLSDVDPGVKGVVSHLLGVGGKRIRPSLVFLAAKFGKAPHSDKILPVAAATELIHMATLVHDDVVDQALVRRGRLTVHTKWSRRVAVLAGDYLFAQAFRLLARTGDPRATDIMAKVVYDMCQGEIQESIVALEEGPVSEAVYLERIGKKTAIFLAESCRIGAIMADADERFVKALETFGWGLGLGFQIVDDMLDLTASSVSFGKALGADLRAGIMTLPLIHALAHSPDRLRLAALARQGARGEGDVAEVRGILGASGSFAYAEQKAKTFVADALEGIKGLPSCEAKEALTSMASFVMERQA